MSSISRSYEFEKTSIKYVMGLLGLALVAVSGALAWLGINSVTDVQRQVQQIVERELNSDEVRQVYQREIESLRLQLILDRWELRGLSNQLSRGTDDRRFAAIEIEAITAALQRPELADRTLRVLLSTYTDDVDFPLYFGVRPEWRALSDAVRKARLDPNNSPVLRGDALRLLLRMGDEQARNEVVTSLRDFTNGARTVSSNDIRDNVAQLALELAQFASRAGEGAKGDIRDLAAVLGRDRSVKNRVAAVLASALVDAAENSTPTPAALDQYLRDGPTVDAVVDVVTAGASILFRTIPLQPEVYVIDPATLAKVFRLWAAPRERDVDEYWSDWYPVTKEARFYRAFAPAALSQSCRSEQSCAFAIKQLIPDGVFADELRSLPVLFAHTQGQSPHRIASPDDGGMLETEDGEPVDIAKVTRWEVRYISNPDFAGL